MGGGDGGFKNISDGIAVRAGVSLTPSSLDGQCKVDSFTKKLTGVSNGSHMRFPALPIVDTACEDTLMCICRRIGTNSFSQINYVQSTSRRPVNTRTNSAPAHVCP